MTVQAILGWTMVLAAFGTFCSSGFTDRRWVRLVTAAAVPAVAFGFPIDDMPLVGFLRAVLAEPSVALILISAFYCARRTIGWQLAGKQLDVMLACVFALGAVVFPSALGVSFTDLYALGYSPHTGLMLLFAAVLAYLLPSSRLVAFWIAGALFAHGYGFGESNNLLDYLIDPVAVFCALIHLTRSASRKVRNAN